MIPLMSLQPLLSIDTAVWFSGGRDGRGLQVGPRLFEINRTLGLMADDGGGKSPLVTGL